MNIFSKIIYFFIFWFTGSSAKRNVREIAKKDTKTLKLTRSNYEICLEKYPGAVTNLILNTTIRQVTLIKFHI